MCSFTDVRVYYSLRSTQRVHYSILGCFIQRVHFQNLSYKYLIFSKKNLFIFKLWVLSHTVDFKKYNFSIICKRYKVLKVQNLKVMTFKHGLFTRNGEGILHKEIALFFYYGCIFILSFYCFVLAVLIKDIFAIQVRYPDRITLIRGNHESRQITQV